MPLDYKFTIARCCCGPATKLTHRKYNTSSPPRRAQKWDYLHGAIDVFPPQNNGRQTYTLQVMDVDPVDKSVYASGLRGGRLFSDVDGYDWLAKFSDGGGEVWRYPLRFPPQCTGVALSPDRSKVVFCGSFAVPNVTFDTQIAAANDDAFQDAGGTVAINGASLALNAANQWAAFRFSNVTIPAGSHITAAKVILNFTDPSKLTLVAASGWEFAADSAPLAATTQNISNRTWLQSSSHNFTASGTGPHDIATSISFTTDFVSGNHLTFIMKVQAGSNAVLGTFDGDPAVAAKLHIEYDPPTSHMLCLSPTGTKLWESSSAGSAGRPVWSQDSQYVFGDTSKVNAATGVTELLCDRPVTGRLGVSLMSNAKFDSGVFHIDPITGASTFIGGLVASFGHYHLTDNNLLPFADGTIGVILDTGLARHEFTLAWDISGTGGVGTYTLNWKDPNGVVHTTAPLSCGNPDPAPVQAAIRATFSFAPTAIVTYFAPFDSFSVIDVYDYRDKGIVANSTNDNTVYAVGPPSVAVGYAFPRQCRPKWYFDRTQNTTVQYGSLSESTVKTSGTITAGSSFNLNSYDGGYYTLDEESGAIDFYSEFHPLSGSFGGIGVLPSATLTAVQVFWAGHFAPAGSDVITVQAFNWHGSSWDTIGTISAEGTADKRATFSLSPQHTSPSASQRYCRIRFLGAGLSSGARFATDYILVKCALVGPQDIGLFVAAETDGDKVYAITDRTSLLVRVGHSGTADYIYQIPKDPTELAGQMSCMAMDRAAGLPYVGGFRQTDVGG